MTHNRGTFIETYVGLNVQAALASPQVLALSDSEVAEGSSVNLTCTAAAPCPDQPPNITWSLHTADISTHIQDEKDGTKILVSFLTFTASRSHHGREIFCMASYLRHNRSAWEANSTVQILSILFSPGVVEASVSPSGAVAEGSSVTLTCNSSEANPPVHNYTWFRDTQTSPVGSGPNITFNVSSSHAGLYYCRAEHPQGGKESGRVRVKLDTGFLPDKMDTFLIVGATGGSLAVLLVVLIICVARQCKSTPLQPQSSECETSATCDEDGSTPANKPKSLEDQQEEIHYGEINFSKLPLRETSHSQRAVQEQEPETEYAVVRLSPNDAQMTDDQTDANNEDLYAQVKK
ncbi:hypothetical protein ACEWY4_018808 [Coilia grayii]|uniref:Ig-like domain-containing protein n=1 Tax=Coilia grayii TaxID=363190 RepID=A0ABD1JHJ0_9TELE